MISLTKNDSKWNPIYKFSSILLTFLLLSSIAYGKNYYISSTSGNDSNAGTSPSAPWKSLSKLYNSWNIISAGDSILLKRGDTFAPSSVSNKGVLEIPKDKSGSEGAYIVIGAYGSGDKPIISKANVSTYSFGVYAKTFAYFIIRDLKIIGGMYFLPGEGDMGAHHLKFLNLELEGNNVSFLNPYQPANTPDPNVGKPLHHIEMGYCIFRNSVGEDAFNIAETQGYNWFHHNQFYNVEEEAIDMGGGEGSIVEYNFVSGTTANGIKLHSQFMKQTNTIIRGNVIHLGAGNYSYPLAVECLQGAKIYNNTLVGTQYAAFIGWLHANPPLITDRTNNALDMSNNEFYNNIFNGTVIIGIAKGVTYTYRNGTQATLNQDDIWDDNYFSNNLFYTSYDSKKIRVFYYSGTIKYDASVAPYGRYSSSLTQSNLDITSSNFATLWEGRANVTNDLYADPQFLNTTWSSATSYGDYHLQSTSPAIGSGKIVSGWNYDMDNKLIPSGSAPDRGAYQKNSSGGTADITAPYITNASISNSTTVVVNFSEAVTSASAALTSNYSISGGVTVNSVSLNSAATQATLTTSAHTAGVSYTVTANGIKDAAGNSIASGSNSATYTLAVTDMTAPVLNSASISNATTLLVSFSEPVTSATATLVSNYSITGSVTVVSASLNTAGTQVTLTTSAHTAGQTYTLSVSNIKDAAGNTIASSSSAQYTMPSSGGAASKLSISAAMASGTPDLATHGPEKTIDGKGTYSGDPDSRWAAEPMPQYIVYDLGAVKEVSSVKFSFFKWNEGRIYQYTVAFSSDSVNWTEVVPQSSSLTTTEWTTHQFTSRTARYVKLQFITSNQASSTWNGFAGLWETEIWGQAVTAPSDVIPPVVSSAAASNATTVLVNFSEKVSAATAAVASNYTISNGISVSTAALNTAGTQVTLTTTAHTAGQTYTLTVANVKDVSGNTIQASNTAQYTMPDITAPSLSNAAISNATTVVITFSEKVSTETANSISNYSVSNGVTVSSAQLNTAGTQVTLTTSVHTEGQTYTLTVSNIKDMAGNIMKSTAAQYTLPVSSVYVELNLKVMLMGSYSAGSMTTSLRSVMPLKQPYSAAPWNYNGSESVSSMPADITDWLLIELRSSSSASTIVAKKAVLLKSNGTIVDVDGTSKPRVYGVKEGSYYVVIIHRNHLGIMSKNMLALSTASSLYDFSASASRAYGSNPLKYLGNGLYGMRAGDGNADGYVTAYDKNSVWLVQYNAKSSGYLSGDYNMDGTCTLSDRDDKWSPNNGCKSQIPQ